MIGQSDCVLRKSNSANLRTLRWVRWVSRSVANLGLSKVVSSVRGRLSYCRCSLCSPKSPSRQPERQAGRPVCAQPGATGATGRFAREITTCQAPERMMHGQAHSPELSRAWVPCSHPALLPGPPLLHYAPQLSSASALQRPAMNAGSDARRPPMPPVFITHPGSWL